MEMIPYEAIPNNSRYIPFTQQSYCCVPTSIQMIMYRNNLPLVPAEELGYHLGLTVPPEDAHLFHNVRVSNTPPTTSGYGTQISLPEYEPNKAFRKLAIPLSFSKRLASQIADENELLKLLQEIEESNADALLCFNHGVIRGNYEPNSGHVVVFDRLVEGKFQVVDAGPGNPKWRLVEPHFLFDAIRQHGDENSGGIWYFRLSTE
jgi:hypothetical protein